MSEQECPGCAALRKRVEALERAMEQMRGEVHSVVTRTTIYGSPDDGPPPFRSSPRWISKGTR